MTVSKYSSQSSFLSAPTLAREQVVHDHVCVVPQRVGGQEQLLARRPLHLKQRPQALVLHEQRQQKPRLTP